MTYTWPLVCHVSIDTRARFKRMQSWRSLPGGFDAFGLPAEKCRHSTAFTPKVDTGNIENMRRQLKSMGAMFDWRRRPSQPIRNITAGPNGFSNNSSKNDAAAKEAKMDFYPQCNTTGARTSSRGRSALRNAAAPGDQERPETVVLPHHELRR